MILYNLYDTMQNHLYDIVQYTNVYIIQYYLYNTMQYNAIYMIQYITI